MRRVMGVGAGSADSDVVEVSVVAEGDDAKDLTGADTSALRAIAELTDQREEVESELMAAVQAARKANRSWAEIGAMLGVSKQAAQRKYSSKVGA